ncbi:tRNA (adenosine(37)-N6)-threonylcarbamoyltransferase complex transferase subunit TsaD [Streptococcus sp. 10F2]
MKETIILAFETSCDETSVAVLKDGELVSNIIASQIESHKRFGGVVPEVASRHHVEIITVCIEEALQEAAIEATDVDAVAVTYGPGLVGALLVGLSAAKAFAWAHGIPLIPVNHMAGHLMAAQDQVDLEFPLLALLVSGGHTELVYVTEPGEYHIVGETRDDAVGEAYDKVGRVMGLSYPAGRQIDELAHQGRDVYNFPRAMLQEDNLEFSFSGLKSAFINLYHNAQQKGQELSQVDLAASFQAAVLDILIGKTKKALEKYPVKMLVVAGGVAANTGLRQRLAEEIQDIPVVIPPLRLCGDNAGMIAYASVSEWNKGRLASWDLNAKPSLAFPVLREQAMSEE